MDLKNFRIISKELYDECVSAGNKFKEKEKRIPVYMEYVNRYVSEYVWPAGSQVDFQWVVYPDGKRFELSSFGNDSWQKLKCSLDDVLSRIYSL